LIAFAGSAFPVCPLTSDYAAFRQVLDESGVDTIPYGGTDFSALTKEVMNAFAGTQTGSRLMILVSDGEDHGTSTATAAQKLRESGLTICGVTVGSDAGAVIPLPDGNFLKDRDDTIVRSRANPITLDLFSNRNLRLDSSGDALVRLVDDVRPLLLQSSTKSSRQRQSERFQIPLAAAVLLLVIDAFLTLRRQP
jgi:Ca-activated chloride channel family protein